MKIYNFLLLFGIQSVGLETIFNQILIETMFDCVIEKLHRFNDIFFSSISFLEIQFVFKLRRFCIHKVHGRNVWIKVI